MARAISRPGMIIISSSTIPKARTPNTGSMCWAAGSGSSWRAIRRRTKSETRHERQCRAIEFAAKSPHPACRPPSPMPRGTGEGDNHEVPSPVRRMGEGARRADEGAFDTWELMPMSAFRRLEKGGRIDRGKPVTCTYDGKPLSGFAGDTLASALLANGKTLTSRSFKYHRPRGIVSAGVEEPNGLFTIGKNEPNIPATTVDLTEGLVAKSQNAWPSPDFDVMAVNSLLSPMFQSGFYYKTFMGPFKKSWMFYEPFI